MRLDRTHSAFFAALLLLLANASAPASPPEANSWPTWLPRYDVGMDLDLANHRVQVRMRTTWTNPQSVPTRQLVFNAHSHTSFPAPTSA